MNVLETRALGKRYRWSWALRDCSLAIPAGHVAALVGPNGAGKTTLLHLAADMVQSTSWFSQHHIAMWAVYQPASRFWPFQWIEFGWLAALSLVLAAGTVLIVRRRPV